MMALVYFCKKIGIKCPKTPVYSVPLSGQSAIAVTRYGENSPSMQSITSITVTGCCKWFGVVFHAGRPMPQEGASCPHCHESGKLSFA